jgi:hypothetical protein
MVLIQMTVLNNSLRLPLGSVKQNIKEKMGKQALFSLTRPGRNKAFVATRDFFNCYRFEENTGRQKKICKGVVTLSQKHGRGCFISR